MYYLFITEPEEDIHLVLNQIRHDNCNLPELERHWSATVNYRLNTIKKATSTQEIFKEWPSYMIPMGYKLVCKNIFNIVLHLYYFVVLYQIPIVNKFKHINYYYYMSLK